MSPSGIEFNNPSRATKCNKLAPIKGSNYNKRFPKPNIVYFPKARYQ